MLTSKITSPSKDAKRSRVLWPAPGIKRTYELPSGLNISTKFGGGTVQVCRPRRAVRAPLDGTCFGDRWPFQVLAPQCARTTPAPKPNSSPCCILRAPASGRAQGGGSPGPPGSLAPPDVGLQAVGRSTEAAEAKPGGPAHRRLARGLAGRARAHRAVLRESAPAARARLASMCARPRPPPPPPPPQPVTSPTEPPARPPARSPAAPRPAPRATASRRRGLRRPSDDALGRLRPGRG